jgi:hypothetical protein
MKYKPEQEVELTLAYSSAESDEDRKIVVSDFATKYQTSKHSIIGKLSSMGVYKVPKPTTKNGEPIIAKEQYVAAIRIMLGARDNQLESLEKASKQDLKTLSDMLIGLSEKFNVQATNPEVKS